jgi:mono/diheme cytochrome c family protein
MMRYVNNCAGCHTTNVKNNVLNVTKAATVSGLNAAVANVGSMNYLSGVLTAQDKLDLAAYITSAR